MAARTGGWHTDSCGIDVVACVKDKEAFLKRYVDGNRPVLLRGFLQNERRCAGAERWENDNSEKRAAWPWPAMRTWTRESLLGKHGALAVPARRSSQTANEYSKALGSGIAANKTTLADYMYVADMQRSAVAKDTDPPYLFEPVVLPETRGTDYDILAALFDDP